MNYLQLVAWDKGWNKGIKAGTKSGESYAKELIIHFLRREGYIDAAEWIRKNYDKQT